jgi:hypothetical protein
MGRKYVSPLFLSNVISETQERISSRFTIDGSTKSCRDKLILFQRKKESADTWWCHVWIKLCHIPRMLNVILLKKHSAIKTNQNKQNYLCCLEGGGAARRPNFNEQVLSHLTQGQKDEQRWVLVPYSFFILRDKLALFSTITLHLKKICEFAHSKEQL